ncbi:DUF202 domain-containing protein [Gephyromycinifex aptenodytis]|uniref:DUF202 domain-containing protein n=1 Tax=Gephyromycinifex aptenodytis TaxID=2716227 RepID=UPI001445E972|nr:DUF202 domain-containing protein [Gephyromycinifex aptenodytis]
MKPRTRGPVDDGLQQERTILAWDRTGLALIAAAVGVGRHALGQLGALIIVPCAIVATCGMWIVLVSWRQQRLASDSAVDPGFFVVRDGRLFAGVAALMGLLCLFEAVAAVAEMLTHHG